MWLGYCYSQWLNVGFYMVGMIVLFTGIFIASSMGANYLHKEELKINKLKSLRHNKRVKTNKKKFFIDVA